MANSPPKVIANRYTSLVLIIVAFLAAAPNIVFLIAGVDVTTGCATDDVDNCLSQDDDSVEGAFAWQCRYCQYHMLQMLVSFFSVVFSMA